MRLQVIIIGGGPAGIACALWLRKLGVAAVLLEAAARLGGLQTRSPYENLWIPGVQGLTGHQVAGALEDHALALGVEVHTNSRVLSVEHQESGDYTASIPSATFSAPYLVLATGTRPCAGDFTPSPSVAIGPGTPMEALEVTGRRIAILGGGDNAFDQARFVEERGGTAVIFTRSVPRAQRLLQEMIPNVQLEIGAYHADPASMTVNGQAFDAFGVMFGYEAVVPAGLTPDLDRGYIAVNRQGETSLDRVYACGEVTDYWHPCVSTAIAHGVQVAKQVSLKLAG